MQVKIWEKGSEETIRQKLRKILNNSHVDDDNTLDESVEHNTYLENFYGLFLNPLNAKRKIPQKKFSRKIIFVFYDLFIFLSNSS